jgi:Putative DNA-binding domain
MTPALFEQLLHEEESESLDFKQAQYPFARASEEEKSEILKDIFGFANAFRRADAYILLGVEEVRGGRSSVIGVSEHLDDHSLQQFVGHLTSRAVRFGYEALSFEGKQVGVIKIDRQPRPVYLKKNFGRLEKDRVYVRRGSSTDPTRPASPDEIALMGLPVEFESHVPELAVEFAETERDRTLGNILTLTTQLWELPSFDDIPDLDPPSRSGPFGMDLAMLEMRRPNRDYYREFATYLFSQGLFKPIRLVLTNVGSVPAADVCLTLNASANTQTVLSASGDVPERPEAELVGPDMSTLRNIRRVSREPGDVEITKDSEVSRADIVCGLLQPGRKVWTESFHLGVAANGTVVLAGSIYARNLPKPESFSLTTQSTCKKRSLTVRRLRSLADGASAASLDDDQT